MGFQALLSIATDFFPLDEELLDFEPASSASVHAAIPRTPATDVAAAP